MFERQHMRLRQIADMNIVTHTGTVSRRIIGTENRNLLAHSLRCFQNQRNKMAFRAVVLADIARRGSTGSVKITQSYITHIIGMIIIRQHAFNYQLGTAVNVSRCQTAILSNRHCFRLTVNSCGRRKYHAVHTGTTHSL